MMQDAKLIPLRPGQAFAVAGPAIINSRLALGYLRGILPDEFDMAIVENF